MNKPMNEKKGRGTEKGVRGAWSRYWYVFLLLLVASAMLAAWQFDNSSVSSPDDKQPRYASLTSNQALARKESEASVQQATARESANVIPVGYIRAPSGKLLPRFATLARPGAKVRVGPSPEYPVAWVMRLKDIPLEVMAEVGDWLRVRDHEGEEGWLHISDLSEKRSALVAPWNNGKTLPLRRKPDEDAPLVALVKSGAIVWPLTCNGHWCRVRVANVHGWIEQQQLWGVYASERF